MPLFSLFFFRHYTFVGIVEMREDSDRLLERLLPDYFGGLATAETSERQCFDCYARIVQYIIKANFFVRDL